MNRLRMLNHLLKSKNKNVIESEEAKNFIIQSLNDDHTLVQETNV